MLNAQLHAICFLVRAHIVMKQFLVYLYHRNETVINVHNHCIGHKMFKVNLNSFFTHEELSYDILHAYVLVICVGFIKKISSGRLVISRLILNPVKIV